MILAGCCKSSLDGLESLLRQSRSLCEDSDTRLLVMLLPIREQVYESDWQRSLAYNLSFPDPGHVDMDAPNRAVRTIALRAEIELVDMLEPMRRNADPVRLYRAGLDPHLTPSGHRLVGETLARYVESNREPDPLHRRSAHAQD